MSVSNEEVSEYLPESEQVIINEEARNMREHQVENEQVTNEECHQ